MTIPVYRLKTLEKYFKGFEKLEKLEIKWQDYIDPKDIVLFPKADKILTYDLVFLDHKTAQIYQLKFNKETNELRRKRLNLYSYKNGFFNEIEDKPYVIEDIVKLFSTMKERKVKQENSSKKVDKLNIPNTNKIQKPLFP